MKKTRVFTLLFLLLAVCLLTAAASSSGSAGSQSDPLVTLSYLTDTFTGQILEKVDGLIAQRNGQTGDGAALPSDGGGYAAVTLAAGQTLYGESGCEILLRSGGASLAAESSPGLVDSTSGGSLENGAALQINHLYLMTSSRAVSSASGALLLARGTYRVG